MPIFQKECPQCGHEWEALILKPDDKTIENICHKCGFLMKEHENVPAASSYRIKGYAARNSYGLKKFNDGR